MSTFAFQEVEKEKPIQLGSYSTTFPWKNSLFSEESKIELLGNFYIVEAQDLNRKIVLPKVNKKAIGVFGAALILISIIIGVFLNQCWKIASLEKVNNELLTKLEDKTQELESLQKNYTDLQNGLTADSNPNLKPPIETRLGIKLMDNGQRFGKYYLGVTGEVQNAGNQTAYNVTLIFKLYTNNGTQVKPQIIGTLKPYETISTRLTIWSEIGTITSWELEPAATYEP